MAKQIPRTTSDLLSVVDEYFEFLPAAAPFKKWGGIWLISAALSRRCWTIANPVFGPLYPNLFVMLVGNPGSGKDAVINQIVDILRFAHEGLEQGQGFQFSGRSLSPKGVIDLLNGEDSEFNFQRRIDGKMQTVKYHSFLLCAPEFTTVMPVYNTQLIAFLNELYNCSSVFEEQVRGRGAVSQVSIKNPHVAAFMGIQPATLFEVFPEQAFRMGFFSRVNMIYTEETFPANPFDDAKPDRTDRLPRIITDVRSIAQLSGEFKPTKAAGDLIKDFANNGPGALKQSRFLDYNTRRWMHLTKIALACSASESNSLTIEVPHVERAMKYLVASEKVMPKVFENISTADGFEHTVEQLLVNTRTSIITHQELERALRRTHRPYEVGQIIASMLRAGDLEEIATKKGLPKYQISDDAKRKLR